MDPRSSRPPEADLLELPFKEARQTALRRFESHYVRELLERSGDNVSAAARTAQVDRTFNVGTQILFTARRRDGGVLQSTSRSARRAEPTQRWKAPPARSTSETMRLTRLACRGISPSRADAQLHSTRHARPVRRSQHRHRARPHRDEEAAPVQPRTMCGLRPTGPRNCTHGARPS